MRDFEPAKMKRVPFTGIRRVLEKANKLEAEGRKIVHFEVGQPDFDTPTNIKEAAKKALDQCVTAYSSNYGDIRLAPRHCGEAGADESFEGRSHQGDHGDLRR